MSQQKIVFTACILAGLVAMVSCQGVDVNKCTQESMKKLEAFRGDLQKALLESITSMASSTGQSLNMDQLMADLNNLSESASQMVPSAQGGINASEIMGSGMKLNQQVIQLFMKYANLDMSMNSLTQSMSTANKISSIYVKLITDIVKICSPTANQI